MDTLNGEIMKLIRRNQYIDQLNSVKDTPDIKVITGIRRAGKSKLLEAFIDEIRNSELNCNIIHINYNLNEFSPIAKKEKLIEYVESKFIDGKDNYLLIDEIQQCKHFEKAINSFHASEKYKIFITGSNAFLMSSDLATLFTGRTYEIEVYPFSFKEYLQYYENDNHYLAFNKYMLEGGMAGSYQYKDQQQKFKYLKGVYDTLVLRDIVQKHKIKNVDTLNKISDYLIDNISNQLSSRNVTSGISDEDKTTHRTVKKHIDYLCGAFAFYKFRRYDLKGKKYLTTNEKYYLADHSFKYAKHGTRNMDFGRTLENIVAIELLRRGYEVYTGTLYKKEIDFVAIRQNEKYFIQVSNNIEDPNTLNRELSPLRSIKEEYPKMIIARTMYPEYDIDGIKVIDIADWLLQS